MIAPCSALHISFKMKPNYRTIFYLILALNLGIIGYFWWQGSATSLQGSFNDISIALGQLTGLLANFCALMQIILIGRTVWLEKTFGLDKLTGVHRLNGYFTIGLILLHPLFLTIGYANSINISVSSQISDFWNKFPGVNQAIISAFIFVISVFLSIYIVRRKLRYETWYYLHLLTYVAIALAFAHQIKIGSHLIASTVFLYYWIGLYIFVFGNLIVFHYFKPLYSYFRFQFTVEKIIQETNDTWSVYIKGKNLKNWHAKAGQFISIRFLTKAFWWQSHPFSLSTAPNSEYIRLTIKASGDFTRQIQHLIPGTKAIIGGPYGIFTATGNPATKYLLIAGGVGISPVRSLLEQVAPTNNVILVYSNRDQQNVILREELDNLSKTHNFPIHYLYTNDASSQGPSGRLDGPMLKNIVPDLKSREIYLCGPKAMTDALVKAMTHTMSIPKSQVHYEKFSF